MFRRLATVTVATSLLLTVFVSSAIAREASFDPPVAEAELVSREAVSGARAVQSALSTIDSVDLNADSAVVTVDDVDGPHAITLDYGDLLTDKRTAGAGYFAGAYVALGVISRAIRLLRGLFAFGG